MKCPSCAGPGILLGSLGFANHFRCRDCGSMFYKMSKPRKPKVKPEASCDGFDGQFEKMYGKPFRWSGRK